MRSEIGSEMRSCLGFQCNWMEWKRALNKAELEPGLSWIWGDAVNVSSNLCHKKLYLRISIYIMQRVLAMLDNYWNLWQDYRRSVVPLRHNENRAVFHETANRIKSVQCDKLDQMHYRITSVAFQEIWIACNMDAEGPSCIFSFLWPKDDPFSIKFLQFHILYNSAGPFLKTTNDLM